MYFTLDPNSTRLARFWTALATKVRVRDAIGQGGSAEIVYISIVKVCQNVADACIIKTEHIELPNHSSPAMMLKILGLTIAGQINLRKTNPLEKKKYFWKTFYYIAVNAFILTNRMHYLNCIKSIINPFFHTLQL